MKIFPKKSLGQNFLKDKVVLGRIIDAGNINQDETIFEIGPGTGILTEELLKKVLKVIAVEKDDILFLSLKEQFSKEIHADQLQLVHDDILKLNLADFELRSGQYKLIANIPYYITGAILEKFLSSEQRPSKMVLLVQKEVAERIVTRDGKESILSISVKAFGNPKIHAKVPRGAFVPAPSVDSAILVIENISDTQFKQNNITVVRFFEIVRAGFAHKRKYAIRNLEIITKREVLEHVWAELNIDPKERAENIKIDTWFKIATKIA